MDFSKRYTKKYVFKSPNLERLKELGLLVVNQDRFRHGYGGLLDILWTNVDQGLLKTLIQFYDPLYHCFTFPDYQLLPTLEEYSVLAKIPVLNRVPFTGLEKILKPSVIAAALHLETSEVESKLVIKGKILGLSSAFLYQKASELAATAKVDAFDVVLALLIYGLVLFPNVDEFVDINAIMIFLTKNHVPTLLADTYHSIQGRVCQKGGMVVCCAPLLHKWFISHLPRSHTFRANAEEALWSDRIMSLTPDEIVWYDFTQEIGAIIDGCGEFLCVPLLSRFGGVTYSPALARRQMGYPMKAKPDNISLSGVFYHELEVNLGMKQRFAQAWRSIHWKNRNQLGRRSSFVSEAYVQWVINRAKAFGLPYPLHRIVSATPPIAPVLVPVETREEFQIRMTELVSERNACKGKLHIAERQIEALSDELERRDRTISDKDKKIAALESLLRAKDAILDRASNKRSRLDFFEGPPSDSEDIPGLQ